MKGRWRWLLWVALVIVTLFVGLRIYFRATDDFRISNIMYDMPYHAEWEIPALSAKEKNDLDAILNQKFTYIGKGAQSYVFGSEDQKYVVKFFKFKHLRPSLLVQVLPDVAPFTSYKQKVAARKQRKLYGVFTGYKLAYDVDKDNSALVFIQLNPTHSAKEIKLVDKLGFNRTVDLGEVAFIVQEKGQTLRNVLAELLNQGDVATAKKRIGQIFDLYLSEYSKGIYDHDHGVMQNAGFIGERPIHLDVGKLNNDDRMRQPEVYQEDLYKVGSKMKVWLDDNYPKQAPEINRDIEAKLSAVFGRPVTLPQD